MKEMKAGTQTDRQTDRHKRENKEAPIFRYRSILFVKDGSSMCDDFNFVYFSQSQTSTFNLETLSLQKAHFKQKVLLFHHNLITKVVSYGPFPCCLIAFFHMNKYSLIKKVSKTMG